MEKKIREITDEVFKTENDYFEFISHYVKHLWGNEIHVMESQGNAYARSYWYKKDVTTIYFSCLNVNNEIQDRGIGTHFLEMHEQIGQKFGFTVSLLRVDKSTWMYDWYKRKGYVDYQQCDEEKNLTWLKKRIR